MHAAPRPSGICANLCVASANRFASSSFSPLPPRARQASLPSAASSAAAARPHASWVGARANASISDCSSLLRRLVLPFLKTCQATTPHCRHTASASCLIAASPARELHERPSHPLEARTPVVRCGARRGPAARAHFVMAGPALLRMASASRRRPSQRPRSDICLLFVGTREQPVTSSGRIPPARPERQNRGLHFWRGLLAISKDTSNFFGLGIRSPTTTGPGAGSGLCRFSVRHLAGR